jgi:O-antigen/teichoic acid export membrane protein
VSDLNARAARGIRALLGRQALVQVLTFGAGIVLARTLTPSQFGLYFIATFFVSTFAFFGDFGFAPSLIQQRGELEPRDLRVAFTLQLAATTAIFAVLVVAAQWLVLLYPHAPHSVAWLIRALALQLYLTTFRSLSVLQLERRLRYGGVAAVEVAEALVFQGIAVGLALSGFGVWSFAVAVVARGLAGCAIAYSLAPWRVGLALDRATARRLLRFGLPFQLTSVAQQAGSWVTPVLVGSMLGPAAVGLLTWASSNARKPLMLVENVMRVAFPHFSRLQDDRAEVERVLSRYLRSLLLGAGLWFSLIVVSAPGLVPLVYGHRWASAVPALTVFAGALLFDTVAWLLGTTLFGLGEVAIVARANVYRTVVFVGLGVTLVLLVGLIGVAIAALVSVAAIVPMLLARFRDGRERLAQTVVVSGLPIALAVAGGLVVRALPVPEPARSVAAGVACLLVFVAVSLFAKLVRKPLRPVVEVPA